MKRKPEEEIGISSAAILGTYEGECADANITNANGLDITRPVWETVFASDEYKKAIKLQHYIGFLGHPEDPNCMDFEHACIVMTEGHIDDSGKIYGKFNLIDTPVGRVVKAFQDAGVQFGISVRGAGDIIDNSVDPDTFVFRGFDLVTFPAYPDAIPTFTAIAASADPSQRKKYQKVCAAVKQELPGINSSEALETIKSQFAAQSEPYKAIEAKQAILAEGEEEDEEASEEEKAEVTEQKLEGMTQLYLDAVEANKKLNDQLIAATKQVSSEKMTHDRQLRVVRRIVSSQLKAVKLANVEATEKLKADIADIRKSNLKYKQKIQSSSDIISQKDSTIRDLRAQLAKTVDTVDAADDRASNLDGQNRKLREKLMAAQKLVSQYQDAYANLYASALGVRLDGVSITASTDVNQLKAIITSASSISSSPEPFSEQIDDDAEFDVYDEEDDSIITL